MNWWDFGWWTADRVTAGGQFLGALFTAAAVITALAIAIRDSRRHAVQEHERILTQARLVRVLGPLWHVPESGSNLTTCQIEVRNKSDRPILWFTTELWEHDQDPREDPTYSVGEGIIDPGEHFIQQMAVHYERANGEETPFRIWWHDVYGRGWCVDQNTRDMEPRPYPSRRRRRRGQ